MSSRKNENSKKQISEVVSIDAWFKKRKNKYGDFYLHVHVGFGEALLGGEYESEVRFRLKLRAADVCVRVPRTEPLTVYKSSVARGDGNATVRLTSKSARRSTSRLRTKIGLSLTAIGAQLAGDSSQNWQEGSGSSTPRKAILTTQSIDQDGNYKWSLKMYDGSALVGEPWNGSDKPRLMIRDTTGVSQSRLKPALNIEVYCRREDLLIDDLQFKDPIRENEIRHKEGYKIRKAAAESYIRDLLIKEGLQVLNHTEMAEMFQKIVLSNLVSEVVEEM